jgi:hypothetical protein
MIEVSWRSSTYGLRIPKSLDKGCKKVAFGECLWKVVTPEIDMYKRYPDPVTRMHIVDLSIYVNVQTMVGSLTTT